MSESGRNHGVRASRVRHALRHAVALRHALAPRHAVARALGLAAVIGACAARAGACPTCRDSLAEADARWSRGFALSIAFLLGALAVVGTAFFLAVRRGIRST